MRWCTVTVTDQDGRRHSVDVQATSTFDAAHSFVVEAKTERAVGLLHVLGGERPLKAALSHPIRTVLRGFCRVQIGKPFRICYLRVSCGLPCPDFCCVPTAGGVEAIA